MSEFIVPNNTIKPSTIEKRPFEVVFGNVKDEYRGPKEKLIDPPISLIDNYYWLRNDKRDSQEILDIIETENKYFEHNINHTLTQTIEEEINSRMTKSYETLPISMTSVQSQNRYSYNIIDGKDHPQFIRHNFDNSTLLGTSCISTTMLLDVNDIAYGHKQCDVTNIQVNHDETIMSYGVDFNGSECYEIVFVELDISNHLSNCISSSMENVMYSNYFWINNRIVCYIREDENKRPFEVLFYDVIEKTTKLVYTEENKELNISADINCNNECLFINSSDYDQTKISFIMLPEKELFNNMSLEDFTFNILPICDLQDKVLINAEYFNENFYFLTNSNNSVNYKITTKPLSSFIGLPLSQSDFPDVVPYNPNVTISQLLFLNSKLVFMTTINGNTFINELNNSNIYTFNCADYNVTTPLSEWSTKQWENVNDKIYNISLYSHVHDASYLLIKFESLTTPCVIKQVYINENFHTEDTVWTKEVPNYFKELYDCERIYVTSEDGSKIPCSIMYKKSCKNNGNMPLYMYGYGAYGLTIDTLFNFKNICLLDHGYCFAICHVRGGGFLGRQWYEDGRLEHKINTFTDFHDCAKHLGSLSYINKDNITCEGRSAGGLLAGVMASRYPDTFRNVIMGVPFTDVLITMRDSTIPLTTEEWTQWGNPNIMKDYNTMSQYCPYVNMRNSIFPNTYITTGFHDPRVQYWEGLKFLAKMREHNTGNSIQVIETQIGQGHFGNAGRYTANNECAKKFSFVISH